MVQDAANTIGIISDEDLKEYAVPWDNHPLAPVLRALEIRSEEIWQIMWVAGLIDDGDFYGGHPNYATLMRALGKANELKAKREAA